MIGNGGFSVVFQVFDTIMARLAALKVRCLVYV
jgi:hypothetical protein